MAIDLTCPSCAHCLKTGEPDSFMSTMGKAVVCEHCDEQFEVTRKCFQNHLSPEKREKVMAMKARTKAMVANQLKQTPVTPIKESLSKPTKTTKKCPYCAENILAEAIKCKHCKSDLSPPKNKPTSISTTTKKRKKIIKKTYKGNFNQANKKLEKDIAKMSANGYTVDSKTYTPGQWGCGSFLVAAALCVLLIGFIVFIYMFIVKPPGELFVTFKSYDD